MAKRTDPAKHPPLKDAPFHILLSLADGPRHGYGMRADILARTHGAVRLWPTSLYGTIRQLTQDGLIAPCDGETGEEDPRRRYYELTAKGGRVLVAEIERLRRLVDYARSTRALAGA
jgi:DNA-binding PadR family transcriptional regulator